MALCLEYHRGIRCREIPWFENAPDNRHIVIENDLEDLLFAAGTTRLADIFKVNADQQRIDSVHIKSNMKRSGRIGLFTTTLHKFLVNLKRQQATMLGTLDQALVEKYLSESALSCFSRVKPSESRQTLTTVSQDLFEVYARFKDQLEVAAMSSFKLLERVLHEQCNLIEDEDHPVELKCPKQIASDSLQNPSDPDATYSGHRAKVIMFRSWRPIPRRKSQPSI